MTDVVFTKDASGRLVIGLFVDVLYTTRLDVSLAVVRRWARGTSSRFASSIQLVQPMAKRGLLFIQPEKVTATRRI